MRVEATAFANEMRVGLLHIGRRAASSADRTHSRELTASKGFFKGDPDSDVIDKRLVALDATVCVDPTTHNDTLLQITVVTVLSPRLSVTLPCPS